MASLMIPVVKKKLKNGIIVPSKLGWRVMSEREIRQIDKVKKTCYILQRESIPSL